MKRETLFLKIVVCLIGLAVLALCIFLFSALPEYVTEMNLEFAYIQYPGLFGIYATVIPFFFALYQTLKLLSYIDKNKAFSELSVKALKNIKYCAFTFSILYVVGMPLLFLLGDADDAPGIILIGLILIFASFVIAVFAAVLQKLLKNAIDIKSDNDLTI